MGVTKEGLVELDHDIPKVNKRKDVTKSVNVVGMDAGTKSTAPLENEHYDPEVAGKKDVT